MSFEALHCFRISKVCSPSLTTMAFVEPCSSTFLNTNGMFLRHVQTEPCFGLRQLVVRALARKQVPIHVGGHCQSRVPQPRLHALERQAYAAVFLPVDAPARIEMPQRMHAVF